LAAVPKFCGALELTLFLPHRVARIIGVFVSALDAAGHAASERRLFI
jgi:hypothetical protein